MIKRITLVFCLFYLLSITSAFAFEFEFLFKKDTKGNISRIYSTEKDIPFKENIVHSQGIQKVKKPLVYLDVETLITDENLNPLDEVDVDQIVYYWITFNPLEELNDDFQELIGREFRPKLKVIINRSTFSIRVKTKEDAYFTISEGDQKINAFGAPLRLSDLENEFGVSLSGGKVKFIGKAKIEKVKNRKIKDKSKYPIVE